MSQGSDHPLGVMNNVFISPHAMPLPLGDKSFDKQFHCIELAFQSHPEQFPPSYLPKLDICRTQDRWDRVIRLNNLTWQEILANFAPDPTSLAAKYANGEKLSVFELDRIWAEGTMSTLRFLVQHIPPTDPILIKLANRWDYLNPRPIIL